MPSAGKTLKELPAFLSNNLLPEAAFANLRASLRQVITLISFPLESTFHLPFHSVFKPANCIRANC
jgi:hypothetical protein